jgi:hypothetical protein
MKRYFYLLFFCFAAGFFVSTELSAQCEIRNKVRPDGSMYYYLAPVLFFQTAEKQLQGGVLTDNESFYIYLLPVPFPPKPTGSKLKSDLQLKLSNQKAYTLKHFDTNYINGDTSLQMIYLIDKKDLEDFKNFDIEQVTLNMGAQESNREYFFKLHRKAIKDELSCLKEKIR